MRKKVLSICLAVCMILTLLPISAMAEEDNTSIDKGSEITAFAPLAETEKTVVNGTPIEDLDMPESLTAIVRTAKTSVQDSENQEENSVSGNSPAEIANVSTDAETTGQQESPNPDLEETSVDIPVTWTSKPEYNEDENGNYIFTPVIKDYTVSTDLPQITVTVGDQPRMMALRAGTPTTYGDFSVTLEKDGAAPTFDNGVLTFDTAGNYTISMADGKTSTSNRINVTTDSVTLNLDGVHIIEPASTGNSNGLNALTVSDAVALHVITDSSLTGGAGDPAHPMSAFGGAAIDGNVAITGTAVLTLTAGDSSNRTGAAINGNVDISDTATLIAYAGIVLGEFNGYKQPAISGAITAGKGFTVMAGEDASSATILTENSTESHYVSITPGATFNFCNSEEPVKVKPSANPEWEEEDYVFDGWYTAPNGEGEQLSNSDAGLSGVTYYAKWVYNGHTVRTTLLDLTDISREKRYGSAQNGSVYENASEGWSWYTAQTTVGSNTYAANTLVLSGLTFHTIDPTALSVPDNTTLVLTADTENTVKSGKFFSDSQDVFTYGIYSEGALSINGSGELDALAGTARSTNSNNCYNASSYGIYSCGALNISSGTISATSGYGAKTGLENKSIAIYSNATIEISGGNICGNGNGGMAESYGIAAHNDIKISGGNVSGNGGGDSLQSIGIVSNESITITGGTVNAMGLTLNPTAGIIGDTEELLSAGIVAEKNVTITGGNITATGDYTKDASLAIYSKEVITILGGTVTALNSSMSKGSETIRSGIGLIVGSTANPAAIEHATDGTAQITSSSGKVESGVLVVSRGPVLITFATYPITLNDAANGSYTVKVNDHEATSVQFGETVSITPTANSGYALDTISVYKTGDLSTEVPVTNSKFVMPAYGVTIHVIFKPSSTTTTEIPYTNGNSGGSGTGASSGNGTGSGSNSANAVPIAKLTAPVSGSTQTSAAVDSKGNASVNLTGQDITDAIADAKATASKKGVNAGDITAVIQVTTGARAANSVTVNLPKATQKQVMDNQIASTQLVIDRPDLTLAFSLAAITEINRQAQSDVQLSAVRMANAALSGDAKAAIGNRPAFAFKATYGSGKSVTGFGNGSVSVEIPYTLQKGEVAGDICAVYVDENGEVTYLTNSSYDAKRKTVVFSTRHFSTYGVAYKVSSNFTDISDHWAKDDILFAANRGLIPGTSSTTFSPNASMTRGLFVTALGRLANADTSAYKQSSFTDVKTDADNMGYIEWSLKNNILAGVGDNRFDPDGPVTREQMAVILDRYATAIGFKLPEVHTHTVFADNAKISVWAAPSVNRIQIAGILQSKNNNFYDPQGILTRAEASAALKRFVELTIFNETAQGWVKNDSGLWMYYKNGKALTGSQTIGDTVYCFDSDGSTSANN